MRAFQRIMPRIKETKREKHEFWMPSLVQRRLCFFCGTYFLLSIAVFKTKQLATY